MLLFAPGNYPIFAITAIYSACLPFSSAAIPGNITSLQLHRTLNRAEVWTRELKLRVLLTSREIFAGNASKSAENLSKCERPLGLREPMHAA